MNSFKYTLFIISITDSLCKRRSNTFLSKVHMIIPYNVNVEPYSFNTYLCHTYTYPNGKI